MRRVACLLSAVLLALGLLSVGSPAGATPTAAASPVASPAAVTPSHPTIAGGYNPIPRARVFNTATAGKLAPSITRKVAIGGHAGVPTDAVAVEMNVTVQAPAKAGWLSVFAGTASYKGIATVSFIAAVTKQRMITANLGVDGSINLHDNLVGTNLDVILDVVGYYSGGTATDPGAYHPIPVVRVADPNSGGTLPRGGTGNVRIGGRGAIPPADAGLMVAMNVTAVAPRASGYVTFQIDNQPVGTVAWVGGSTEQQMIDVNVDAISQLVQMVNTGPEAVSLVIDVVGYYHSAFSHAPGGYTTVGEYQIGSPTLEKQSTRTYPVLPTGGLGDSHGLPAAGVWAVRLEFLPEANRPGSIGVSPTDEAAAGVSTMYQRYADSLIYDVTVRVDAQGEISLSNISTARTVVQIRVVGYYSYGPNPLTTANKSTELPDSTFSTISCATSAFCVAGEANGLGSVYDGAAWTVPSRITGLAGLGEVACPAVNDCFAVGADIVHFDGTSWTTVLTGPGGAPALSRISCADTDFCVATFGQRYATWNGTQWNLASGSATGITGAVTDLSCPTTTFCVGLDGPQLFTEFDGMNWSAPSSITGADDSTAAYLSCAAAQHCEVVTGRGEAFSFDGTTWSPVALTPAGGYYLTALSCTSSTSCVALDARGRARLFNGTAWSSPTATGGPLLQTGLSCLVGGNQCISISVREVDGANTALSQSFNGTTWTTPITVTAGYGRIEGLSCPSVTFCTAVTSAGFAVQFDGSRWTDPNTVVARGSLTDVSCSSTTLCVAIQADGAAVFQNGTWTGLSQIDTGNALTSVSCSTVGWCVVGDDHGQVFRYSAGAWSQPQSLGQSPVSVVSCAADASCLSLLADGRASRYLNGDWQSVLGSPVAGAVTLSCASSSYCLASGAAGSAAFNGSNWSSVPAVYTSVSCSDAQQCQGYTGTDPSAVVFWDGRYRSLIYVTDSGEDHARLACPTATLCFYSNGIQIVDQLKAA